MDLTLTILNWLLPLGYLAVLVDYVLTFALRVRVDSRSPWLIVVVLLNVVYLTLRATAGQGPPLGTLPTIPAILALSIAVVYAIVELATRDRRSGVFVMAVVFVFQYTASLVFSGAAGTATVAESAPSFWARLHVLLAVLTYTAAALAAVYGLLYIMVSRGLKQHRFGVFYDRLPPLAMLGHMTWHALLTGFVCMSVALVAAPLLLSGHGDGAAPGLSAKVMAKIVTGLLAWAIYAVAIFGRFARKWDPSKISVVALLGFAAVLLLLIASAVFS